MFELEIESNKTRKTSKDLFFVIFDWLKNSDFWLKMAI